MAYSLSAYKPLILNDFNNRPDCENEFHKQAATRLVELAKVRSSGQQVLDIATGTGLAAIAEDALRSIELNKISVAFSIGIL
jgi:ubiquinone/menaquinone biosynthesis C-methylase UbiE